MILPEILLWFLALVTLVPVSVLFVQVAAALPARRQREVPGGKRPSVAVLVPAHNEAFCIADTLAILLEQLVDGDRLVVVADNCTDDTAAIAIAAGAEVIERKDATRRGKGYALDFAVRHLGREPPDVLIIVDADCHVGEEAIDRLARVCKEKARPIQALNLMHAPDGAGTSTRIAEFALLVKNLVRPLGFQRLGMPCQLMGTGMAFPWPIINTMPLASGHIVEDLWLGIHLTRSGAPPVFCPEARIKSFFPLSREGILSQRTRWEHGHLGMICGNAPRLYAEALARRNWLLLVLLLDLCVPPLALLMLLALAVSAGSTAFFVATGVSQPLWLAAVALALLGAAVLLSWLRFGRTVVPLGGLFHVPVYLLAKLPVYASFILSRQVEWVRSQREKQ